MKTRTLIISILVGVLVNVAAADYIDLPVKWSQVPWDPNGRDYHSMHPHQAVVADDFICDTPDPIVAVRWWGSYLNVGAKRPNGFTLFDISFHLSVPDPNSADGHPFSLPGTEVYLTTVSAQEVHVGFNAAGEAVYRYDAYLPERFDQWQYSRASGIPGELWIDIDKPFDEEDQHWGWHEVTPPHPILDYAAVATSHFGPWRTIPELTDMAFELMIPEPGTMALLATGGLALLIRRRRR